MGNIFKPLLRMFQKDVQAGYTLVELLLVIGVAAILLSLITFNVAGAQRSTSVSTVVDMLIADMKSQQVKAMNGTSVNGMNTDAYGLYFKPDTYVLFNGSSYDPSSPDNYAADTGGAVFVQTAFPGSMLVFSPLTGEVSGYSGSANTVTIKSVAGSEQRTITVNKYGVVVGVH